MLHSEDEKTKAIAYEMAVLKAVKFKQPTNASEVQRYTGLSSSIVRTCLNNLRTEDAIYRDSFGKFRVSKHSKPRNKV